MSLPVFPELITFLQNLFNTNAEFIKSHDDSFFATFQDRQNPQLTILKCSDSRVQMESFDKTPQNEVFAIRNIGNQIITSEGSVDFGVNVLNTPFLLIIGHSDCGAVTAAFNQVQNFSLGINRELSTITIKGNCIKEAIINNIHHQVALAMNKYQHKIQAGTLTVLGTMYDFKNDFGYGYGQVVLVNINGITDSQQIGRTYQSQIKNLHFLPPE